MHSDSGSAAFARIYRARAVPISAVVRALVGRTKSSRPDQKLSSSIGTGNSSSSAGDDPSPLPSASASCLASPRVSATPTVESARSSAVSRGPATLPPSAPPLPLFPLRHLRQQPRYSASSADITARSDSIRFERSTNRCQPCQCSTCAASAGKASPSASSHGQTSSPVLPSASTGSTSGSNLPFSTTAGSPTFPSPGSPQTTCRITPSYAEFSACPCRTQSLASRWTSMSPCSAGLASKLTIASLISGPGPPHSWPA